ncbi:MAG: prolyl oligopeptidase family serine peptidase [Daejeonella sp.]
MRTIITTIFIYVFIATSVGQTNQNTFDRKDKIAIRIPYSKLDTFSKWFYDGSFYEKSRKQKQFECLKGTYKSISKNVEVWIYKPIHTKQKKFPLIIYNRGGTGNFGSLEEVDLVNFYKLSLAGYIVIASQYQFIGTNGKYDEIGGKDLNDILNLANVYKALPYIDTQNVFMLGISRGGQMTYQASKAMDLNAIAVIGGTADFEMQSANRPEFLNGWNNDPNPDDNYFGLKNILPEFETHKYEYFRQRSATYWADSIKSPVLILHSRKDQKVTCNQVLKLANQLQKFQKEYSLIIYDQQSHALPFKYFDSFDRIIKWFEEHKKKTTKLGTSM